MEHMRQEIRGYRAVREAARNWEEYSSDLLGDRDVRNYRQLPLEADPPRHTLFRVALSDFFSASSIEKHTPAFEALAKKLISESEARGFFNAVHDLVLPYVIGCLSIIYERPQDFEEWKSWGPDVWTAAAYQKGESVDSADTALRERDFSIQSSRSGETLQAYLDEVFNQAEQRVQANQEQRDIWDFVAGMVIDGTRVNREEMQGIANVLLAGGRDTVIKLLSGFVWHLVSSPEDADLLRQQLQNLKPAIAEMARYISPLPKMERVPREYAFGSDRERNPENYVLLSFVSANHDKSQWGNADQIDFARERNPHVGFGFGAHSCLGQNITELEGAAFLRVLLPKLARWQFAGEPQLQWAEVSLADGSTTQHITGFEKLDISVS